jgi:hypothetical protein
MFTRPYFEKTHHKKGLVEWPQFKPQYIKKKKKKKRDGGRGREERWKEGWEGERKGGRERKERRRLS